MQTSTHEYYGFTLYLTSLTLFATYILVSLAHKPYWAIAIPCYAMTIYPFLLTIFIAVNMLHTPSLHEAATFTDEHANIMTTPISPHADLEYIPEMQDLPISVVNYCMYKEARG